MKIMLSFQCETQEEAQAVLTAVAAIGKEPHACSKQYISPEEVQKSTDVVQLARPNVNPGTSAITKIGSSTLEVILGALKEGQQMPLPKYEEHMKLLWARGKVKFDGKEYYL